MFTYLKMSVPCLFIIAAMHYIGRASVDAIDKSLLFALWLFTLSAGWSLFGWIFNRIEVQQMSKFIKTFIDSTTIQGRVEKVLGHYAKRLRTRFTEEESANAAVKTDSRNDDLQDAAIGATAMAQSAKKRFWSHHGLAGSNRNRFGLVLRRSFTDYLG